MCEPECLRPYEIDAVSHTAWPSGPFISNSGYSMECSAVLLMRNVSPMPVRGVDALRGNRASFGPPSTGARPFRGRQEPKRSEAGGSQRQPENYQNRCVAAGAVVEYAEVMSRLGQKWSRTTTIRDGSKTRSTPSSANARIASGPVPSLHITKSMHVPRN